MYFIMYSFLFNYFLLCLVFEYFISKAPNLLSSGLRGPTVVPPVKA